MKPQDLGLHLCLSRGSNCKQPCSECCRLSSSKRNRFVSRQEPWNTLLFLLSWVSISFVYQQWLKTKPPKGLTIQGKKSKKQYINNICSSVSASCTLLMRVKNITWCKMSTHLLPPRLLYLEQGLRKS